MTNRSIGSIHLNIVAKVDQLEKDMAKAKDHIAGLGKATADVGTHATKAYESFKLWNSFMGRGMTGITVDMMAFSMALRAVQNEVLYVYNNIEKIRGINPEAVQNVQEFKVGLLEIRNTLDNIIATGMSWFAQGAQMVGAGLATMIYGDPGALEAKLKTIDEIKLASDPAHYDKIRSAEFRLSEMQKQTAASMLTQAARVEELNKQYEIYVTRAQAAAKAGDTLLRLQMESEAHERKSEGMRIASDMTRRIKAFTRQEQVEDERLAMNAFSQAEKIAKLTELTEDFYGKVHTRIGAATPKDVAVQGLGPRSPQEIEQLLKDYPKLITYSTELRNELAKLSTPVQEFTSVFVRGLGEMNQALTQFVTGADNDFNKLLKTLTDRLLDTFFSLALINPMLNAVFGGVTGMSVLPALFGVGAKASGGPASGWTLTGERGAEMVRLPAGSSVMPAHETRGLMAGRGGNVYQIDARGADPSVVDRLASALMQLAGPGVVEQRAFAASKDAEWRRSS